MKKIIIIAIALGWFLGAAHPEITRQIEARFQASTADVYCTISLQITQNDKTIFTQTFGNAVPPNASPLELMNFQIKFGKPDAVYSTSLALQAGLLKCEMKV